MNNNKGYTDSVNPVVDKKDMPAATYSFPLSASTGKGVASAVPCDCAACKAGGICGTSPDCSC